MSKKILHIIPSLSRGGAEVLLCRSIDLLYEFEHKIVLLDKTQIELSCNAEIIQLNSSIPKDIFSAIRKLNRIIKDFSPDLINAHLYWAVILIRLCQTKKTPVLQWYHSDLYNNNNKEQYSFKRLLLDKLTIRQSHHLVFVSEYLKSQITLKLGSRGNRFVLYNFVGKEFYNIAKPQPFSENESLKILVVGNLRKQKNHIILLRALSILPSNKFETTIIGDGPMRIELEEFTHNNNLKNIHLPGNVENVKDFLQNSDLFIMPSIFEGFGIALLESMAASRPSIVSDIPVFREIGQDNIVYFNPRDPKELSEKLLKMKDYDLRNEYGSKAHQRAFNFSEEKYLNNIRHIYSQLIQD